MNELKCIIVGGGHAGLGALKAIRQETRGMANGKRIRFVLIDRQPGHVRKVLMFRPAAGGGEIMVPWTRYCLEGDEFLQGTVTSIDSKEKRIRYTDAQGNDAQTHYDLLVVSIGSIIRRPDPDKGGIAMTDPQAATDIWERWRTNLRKAAVETNAEERKRLMAIAVAGAGITGIETSAELVLAMRKEAAALGLNPSDISVYLLNAQKGLFPQGPEKVRRKLEQMLSNYGVTVFHNHKAMREEAGVVTFSNGDRLAVGLCIWTLGLIPNPALRSMGLPLTSEGQVLVNECYRVQGMSGVYSIGDCARIVDPSTGKADQMTCKEAGLQAMRLGKIVVADLKGRSAPIHKSFLETFAFGLGKNRGLIWVRKWGLDIIITGKLAWKAKVLAWDIASWLR